jgi:hypothetical protein
MTEMPKGPHDPTDSKHPLYDPAEDPTHPFYEGKAGAEEVDPEEYKVGPGRPPKQFRWKQGDPSPHPMGRPRKIPSMKPDLKKALESALNEKVVVTRDKKEIVLTKAALGIEQLVNQYAKGDRHARRDVFQYAALLGVELHAQGIIREAMGTDNQAIVDAYVQRLQPSVGTAPDDHVKAPPDLVDDDATKSEPIEKPTTAAQTAIQKPLEPELDERGRPKPRDRAFIQAERERNLAYQKKIQGGS